ARDGQHKEEIKRHAAHAPRVVVPHGVAVDLGGMEVEEDVGEDAQCPAALALIVLDAEDRLVELGLCWLLEGLEVFFCLFLENFDVLPHFVEYASKTSLFGVLVRLVSHPRLQEAVITERSADPAPAGSALRLPLHGYKSAGIIKVIRAALALEPRIEPAGIHHDLPFGPQLHMGTIHGPRRGPFKVDPFGSVAAPVAGAFELVLGRLPIRRATQVRALGNNAEKTGRLFDHPDSVGLLVFLINSDLEVRRITNDVYRFGLKQGAGEEKTQEHQEIGDDESPHTTPDDAPSHLP